MAKRKATDVIYERAFDTPTQAARVRLWLEDAANINMGESVSIHQYKQRPKVLELRCTNPAVDLKVLETFVEKAEAALAQTDRNKEAAVG